MGSSLQFAGMETVITAVVDGFPKLRSKKWMVVIVLCITFWLLGLTMCTRVSHTHSHTHTTYVQ